MGVGQAFTDSPPAAIQKAVQCGWLSRIAMNTYGKKYGFDSVLLIDLIVQNFALLIGIYVVGQLVKGSAAGISCFTSI